MQNDKGCQAAIPGADETSTRRGGATLAELAEALKLPIPFLEKQGLGECKRGGLPAVRIPYADVQGNPLGIHWLVDLQRGRERFEMRKGDKPSLYGLWKLDEIRAAEEVFLVNGVFDFLTCWHHEIAALGLPELKLWRDDWNQYLAGLTVFLWESDAAVLAPKLASTVEDLRVITLPDHLQNLTGAHLRGMTLVDLLRERVSLAVPGKEFCQHRADDLIGKLEREAAPVLEAPDPVELVLQEIRRLGYGGDLNPPLITYLAVSSRLLEMRQGTMPVHLLLVGPPSAGKSYCLLIVLKLLPPESYNKIDAGSPSVLIYDSRDYQHRVAIFSEADSLPAGEDNPAASAIRNMLQDHRISYNVTDRDPDTKQFVVREINKPGPTVLVTTAVRRLGAQLDSRLFSLEVPDGPEQIQAALRTQAAIELEGAREPDPALIAFQSYLQVLAPWDVKIPFARKLAEEIGRMPQANRITRDYARLTSMIKTVAVLRHRHRAADEDGRLIAEIDDYALVYELVGKMYETSVTRVSDKIRAVIRAVEELRAGAVTPVSVTKVADHLGSTKQATATTVKTALKQGWLVNREPKQGLPFDLDLGESLPRAVGLPAPEDLADQVDQEPPYQPLTEVVGLNECF